MKSKTKTLLEIAKEAPGRTGKIILGKQELELLKAILERKITTAQCAVALGTHTGSVQSKITTLVRQAYNQKIIGFLK